MPEPRSPDLSLFYGILLTLEHIKAPYMIIGAFAGTVYGLTRVTYDIDMIVNLEEEHVQALANTYPLPRYYADPEMIRNSIRMGIMFNIIDTNRGEKADLIPLTMTSEYVRAFENRVRRTVEIPGQGSFDVWCARLEDVIIGKLLAWTEGRSRKHETDIYDMMVHQYLDLDPEVSRSFDEVNIDRQARKMGVETLHLWDTIKKASLKESGGV
ncbi:MAG: hypothetical protein ISS57_07365 [Anaerolineales bacterium]|nr:hypothetical protein [Anaerolineales bacterium]